ncbi:MAG: hypothetical protein SAL70_40280 [Scytonema sp. PMC 1070.18]|nr:hypothetical protein [Scytonema sp. PMC 1070.18]
MLEDVTQNAQSGSRIAVAAALVPLAFLLIALLYLVIIVKWISTNFFNLIRYLLTICIIEVRFYWKKMRKIGEIVAEELSELIAKMFQFTSYLLNKIVDDEAIYRNDGNQKSVLVILWRFITWLFLAAVSVLMSILLILTFFTGLPLLHQYLRKLLIDDTDSQDDEV